MIGLRKPMIIVTRAATHKDPATERVEVGIRIACIFQRSPTFHHENPLLRIHVIGFSRRDVEKERIEFCRVR